MTRIIDLTRPLDQHLDIYTEGDYSDPPLTVDTWCTIPQQGYWVSRVSLGTQTGTHIDAPAHFSLQGETLEELPLAQLMGHFYRLVLGSHIDAATAETLLHGYANEPILFLVCDTGHAQMSTEALEALCALPARLWVLSGAVTVLEQPPLYLHQRLAQAQKYLVEDLDPEAVQQVDGPGRLMAFPLKLQGVSGAPCRVVAVLD